MRVQITGVLVVSVLLVLAGCGDVVPRESASSVSPTPAPVPTDDPLATLPPGLAEDGIADPIALAAAHDAALSESAFTEVATLSVQFANGTVLVDRTRVRRVGEARDRWLVTRTYDSVHRSFDIAPGTRVDGWYNRTHSFQRVRGPNRTTYSGPVPRVPTDSLTGAHRLSGVYMAATAPTVDTEDGTVTLRTTTAPPSDDLTEMRLSDLSDWTFTASLTTDGRVRQYRVAFVGVLADTDVTVTGVATVRFGGLGETTVARPAWVDDARET
ncbi:hypothetical protein ACFPYI_20110 [Halomarina salina]|uniref:Outer membrane lipoprotein-sorting protein n=1 Tax=Halomarina salina TaxID=1872699 RepID=A0ABD5RSX9_9EURY|nr:hypothetical protein [Halomarina salina]